MRADDASNVVWTDERIAILRQMWAEGATAPAIAKRLGGLSRSAVLGKIYRLRLGADVRAVAMKEQAPAEALQKPAALERRRPEHDSALPPPPKPQPKGSSPRGKTLLELRNDSCRWPNGDPAKRNFFFCGAPGADLEGGRPYCAHHARRAYTSVADADEDDSLVRSVRNSPSITPTDAPRRYVWRAPVNHSAPRLK